MRAKRRDGRLSAVSARPPWALHALPAAPLAGWGALTATAGEVQRFLLFYSGVFALVALTAAVAAGVAAADRFIVPAPGRVLSQAVHRACSLAAVGLLALHILTEVAAHRSRAADAVVPFAASGRTLYLGLGTVASDLVLLVVATGVARGRFAGRPLVWRVLHLAAYLAWPMAIVHGLLAGRPARPYVDWSYGGCVAAVALALLIRCAAARRRAHRAPHPATAVVPASLNGRPGRPPQRAHRRTAALPAGRPGRERP